MLEVSNLNKINPDSNSYLLDNMTFHIPKGHICGLIGENGAGKKYIKTDVIEVIYENSHFKYSEYANI